MTTLAMMLITTPPMKTTRKPEMPREPGEIWPRSRELTEEKRRRPADLSSQRRPLLRRGGDKGFSYRNWTPMTDINSLSTHIRFGNLRTLDKDSKLSLIRFIFEWCSCTTRVLRGSWRETPPQIRGILTSSEIITGRIWRPIQHQTLHFPSFRFIWKDNEVDQSWEVQLAKCYYDKLFKEYCIIDLSR